MSPTTILLSREWAGRWFLESGIQEPFGGVARYYRSDLGRNHRVSTEITGYATSTLAYLYTLTNDSRYLDAALRAGRFLTRTAWDRSSGVFPFEYAVNGDAGEALSYFFDNGIVVRGLLALWRVSGEAEFLEAARACGPALARDFSAGREFHPVLALPGKAPEPRDARWSRRPGCYQLKSALALRELHAGEAYEQALAYALETHRSFATDPDDPGTMDRLHAYCYFLEGLLPAAARTECAEALVEGIARTQQLLDAIAPVFERSDVRAQLLRVRLFAAALGLLPLDREAARCEARRVLDYQLDDPDPRIRGGFCFGRKGAALLPYVNPVSTAFALQALEMWRAYQSGGFDPAWQVLI